LIDFRGLEGTLEDFGGTLEDFGGLQGTLEDFRRL
jgi:hypothetical protein